MTVNMAHSILLPLFFVIFHNYCVLSETLPVPDIPRVDGSYIAVGEVIGKISDDDYRSQTKFDETFDSGSGSAALTIQEMGINLTFIEDALTGQTFRYSKDGCVLVTAKEWVEVAAPPSLSAYESDDGKVKFSLKQLFNISDPKYSVPEDAGKTTTYRGIPAASWLFRIESVKEAGGNKTVIDIYSYWSAASWKSTSTFGQPIPLGFTITRMLHDVTNKKLLHSEQYINIYSFIHDAVDRKQFEPRQGIQCPGRNSTFTFPVLSQAEAISFRSEVIFPDESEIKTMDVWYDMKNGYHRVDLDRINNQDPMSKSRFYTSDVTTRALDTTYYVDVVKEVLTCEVKPTSMFDWDYQEIINPKLDLKFWNFETMFALDSTKYTYIGKTTKRNIPCHLFQGIRKDWPTKETGIESLWEWCVIATLGDEPESVNFRDKNIGLVSAQIMFNQKNLTSNLKISEKEIGTIIHHFYDFTEEDPSNMDFSTFDISRCFTSAQQRRLEFAIDLKINDANLEVVENAMLDTKFLSAWKTVISEKSKLALNTLRLTHLKAMVWGGSILVSFTALDVHPTLIDDEKQNKPSLNEAMDNLNKSINAGELTIQYTWERDEKPSTLAAAKNTLNDIIREPDEVPTTGSPIPLKSTTSGNDFSLKTPSTAKTSTDKDGDSTTTKDPNATEAPLTKKIFTGHGSGTVAGVSIAMLLVGMTLGVGGTFYKYKGMPSFR